MSVKGAEVGGFSASAATRAPDFDITRESNPAKVLASLNQHYAVHGNAFAAFRQAAQYLKTNKHDPEIYSFATDMVHEMTEKSDALRTLRELPKNSA